MKTHSTAFNGLLSLIPAKYYYDDATQDQWKQKKKLKKEVSKDKRAKLDPESAADADSYNNAGASAKDVMENKAKSAKNVVLPGQTKSETAPAEKPKPRKGGSWVQAGAFNSKENADNLMAQLLQN